MEHTPEPVPQRRLEPVQIAGVEPLRVARYGAPEPPNACLADGDLNDPVAIERNVDPGLLVQPVDESRVPVSSGNGEGVGRSSRPHDRGCQHSGSREGCLPGARLTDDPDGRPSTRGGGGARETNARMSDDQDVGHEPITVRVVIGMGSDSNFIVLTQAEIKGHRGPGVNDDGAGTSETA